MAQQGFKWGLDTPRLLHIAARYDHRWIAVFLAVCFFAVSVFDISTYPLVGPDEPTLSDPALQLVKTGYLRSDVLRENPGWNKNYLLHPPGLTLSTAASYQVFGFGIWQTRLPSILFGALGVALVFLFIREVTQRTTPAILGAVALFSWPAWVLTSKLARMDTGAICFLLMATILVHRSIRSPAGVQFAQLFLAGLCVSAASTFHVASFTWAVALFVTILYFSKRRLLAGTVYGAGAGLLIGAWLIYAIYNIDAFEKQFLMQFLLRTGAGGVLNRFFDEGARYLSEFTRVATIALPLSVATIGFFVTRRWSDRSIQFLFLLTGVLAVGNALVAGKGSGFYTMYPVTLGLCILAIGVASCIEWTKSAGHRLLPAIAVFSFVIFLGNLVAVTYGPRLLAAGFQRTERNYAGQFATLSAALKPGDEVWGSGVAWYAIVNAGARLDIQPYSIPVIWDTHADPARHKYVVVYRDAAPHNFNGFVKVADFGAELPRLMGSQLSNSSYVFELWKSRRIP